MTNILSYTHTLLFKKPKKHNSIIVLDGCFFDKAVIAYNLSGVAENGTDRSKSKQSHYTHFNLDSRHQTVKSHRLAQRLRLLLLFSLPLIQSTRIQSGSDCLVMRLLNSLDQHILNIKRDYPQSIKLTIRFRWIIYFMSCALTGK